jgi:amidase
MPKSLSRRRFLTHSAAAAGSWAVLRGRVAGSEVKFEVEEVEIAALQTAMKDGRLTARALTQAYLDRIDTMDRKGPTLRSILETNPEALTVADALDAERRAKGPRGLLHGIPILLKDNVDTHDKMTTTAGSLALEGSIPPQDSTVAERLRAAGAILLGKTNMSEWANIRSDKSSSGWSGRGGQCRNPYALDRNPCGSSSGSGSAVAASLGAAAIGTETDGSIVCPSNATGLVGIKPTLGLVSRAGIIPIAHSQDTAGPMARTVRDAAILLGAIAAVDPRDAATADAKGRIEADYTKFLDAKGLEGARIGVARKPTGFNRDVDRLYGDAVATLKKLGAVLVDPADVPHNGEYDDTELEVLLYELKADLNAYLKGLDPSTRVKTLADVIAFNEKNADREMTCFGQELFIKAEAKGPLTDKAYLDALAKNRRLSRDEGLDAVLTQNKLDAIVAPTGGPAWLTDCVVGDHFGGGSSTPAAVAGYPAITVPCGQSFGLPVGITFMGAAWSEPKLLRLAYAYEQATRWRKPPRYPASLGLG